MISRLLPFLFWFYSLAGAAGPEDGWKIATWNLQNYLVHNRYEQGEFMFSYPMPEIRKKNIRDLILGEQPDLLFLQEIGDIRFLRELQLDLKAAGLDYPFYQFSGFDGARTGLAWLARFPPVECILHDLSMHRGAQELRFQGKSSSYRFFHVHLKSRFSDDPDDPLASRARHRDIVALASSLKAFLSADPASRFFLVGDFNTPFNDPLLDPLKAQWIPIPACDLNGNPFTYFHHSGSADILDGFWIQHAASLPQLSASIRPLPQLCPSDHRLVFFHLPSPP